MSEPTACPYCGGPLRRQLRQTHGTHMADTLLTVREWGWICTLCSRPTGFRLIGDSQNPIVEAFGALCDFCGGRDPIISYPCRDFDYNGIRYVGAWGACAPCRDLIEANHRESLISRAITGMVSRHPVWGRRMIDEGIMSRRTVRALHALFFAGMVK